MKTLSLVLLMSLSATLTFAQDVSFRSNREKQTQKTKLFIGESSRFAVRKSLPRELMNYQLNQQVEVAISSKTTFKGKVTAITNDAPGLQTIIMQSSETPGLVLSISKLDIQGEGTTYRGVLISKNHSDLLMMEKDSKTGEYIWSKKEVAHMIPD
jgi:hypothetical protein